MKAAGSGGRNSRLMRLATYASVSVAALLIIAKLGAWWLTDSVAMLSSLVDSLLDAGASVVTLFAIRQSLTPPDAEHRFGHGKAEPLAALAQAGLICGSALFLLIEAVPRLLTPQPIAAGGIGLAVMVFSVVATFALTRFQRFVVRRTGSTAIDADALHYVTDLLTNLAVIAALLLSTRLGWHLADPLFALAIAGYIFWSAVRIGRRAFDMLMDRELPEAERQRILEVVRGHSDVLGAHDLKTRASGQSTFIQLHLELDGAMTLYRAHVIADTLEAELQTLYPGAEVIIHQDPHVLSEDTPVYR